MVEVVILQMFLEKKKKNSNPKYSGLSSIIRNHFDKQLSILKAANLGIS